MLSLSAELVILIFALVIIVLLLTIGLLYKLLSFLKSRSDVPDQMARSETSSIGSNLPPDDDVEDVVPETGIGGSYNLYTRTIQKRAPQRPAVKAPFVQPVTKGGNMSNFLQILDRINAVDGEDEEERRERERKRHATRSASSSGIEAAPSDETASQTFIGKEPEARPDPGRIQLGLIKTSEDRKQNGR